MNICNNFEPGSIETWRSWAVSIINTIIKFIARQMFDVFCISLSNSIFCLNFNATKITNSTNTSNYLIIRSIYQPGRFDIIDFPLIVQVTSFVVCNLHACSLCICSGFKRVLYDFKAMNIHWIWMKSVLLHNWCHVSRVSLSVAHFRHAIELFHPHASFYPTTFDCLLIVMHYRFENFVFVVAFAHIHRPSIEFRPCFGLLWPLCSNGHCHQFQLHFHPLGWCCPIS